MAYQAYFDKFPEAPKPVDRDMLDLKCPRGCEGVLRIARAYPVINGDEVMAQCDHCGMIIRATNNTKMLMLVERQVSDGMESWYSTISDAREGWAPANPTIVRKIKKKQKELDDDSAKVACVCCRSTFLPRANATSDKQKRFCPDCRADGSADEMLLAEKEQARKLKEAEKKATEKKKTARKSVKTVKPKKVARKR